MKHTLIALGLDVALRAGAGLLLASPVVAAVASTGITGFPEGDRLLFEPGGLMLVDVARALLSELMPLVRTELVMGLLLLVALLVPYSVVLVAFSRTRPGSVAELLGRACARVPALLSLKGLTLLTQALTAFLALSVALQVRDALVSGTSRRADLVGLAIALVGGSLMLAFGMVRDLASAAAVSGGAGSRVALLAGLSTLFRNPGRILRIWSLAAIAAVSLVAAGALVTGLLDVSRPGAWCVGSVLLVHQTFALGLVLCRAWWLGHALVLVERLPDERQLDASSSARL